MTLIFHRMIGGDHNVWRHRQQARKFNIGWNIKVIGQRDINFSPAQHMQQLRLMRLFQGHSSLYIICLKTPPDRRPQQRRNRDQTTDRNRPARFLANIACQIGQRPGTKQDLARLVENPPSPCGQRQTMCVLAHENLNAQFRLKLRNRRRD